MKTPPRVLVIAGSDSSGGAGLQADLKTLTRYGVYGATAVTAVTVQNTRSVSAIQTIPAAIIESQIRTVLDDIGADVIKIGMLGTIPAIEAVARALSAYTGKQRLPVILDPVMVSTSGDLLLEEKARRALIDQLLPLTYAITPNIVEAEILSGLRIRSEEDMIRAAEKLASLTPALRLMKGGHLASDILVDMMIGTGETVRLTSDRIKTPHTHGTGCTFASAFAAGTALGYSPDHAFRKAHTFVRSAIQQAPGFGTGSGPVDHLYAKF